MLSSRPQVVMLKQRVGLSTTGDSLNRRRELQLLRIGLPEFEDASFYAGVFPLALIKSGKCRFDSQNSNGGFALEVQHKLVTGVTEPGAVAPGSNVQD